MAEFPLHGGPDALGVPAHDFSTNANACGPCPAALEALQRADRSRYPDPAYTALRVRLAAFHGVEAGCILIAGSASEFIHRITACAVRSGLRHVALPAHGDGDYARAAMLWGLEDAADRPALHWACEPASPLGTADETLARPVPPGSLRVIDYAYAPLRLEGGAPPLPPDAWQLWTPNKALGLTGVRAAYTLAPDAEAAGRFAALAPSWPVGAHGVALLAVWQQASVQRWLAECLPQLRTWKARQQALCTTLGWQELPGSTANFFCARPPQAHLPQRLAALRAAGIKLRECSSFGLPGVLRLGVLPPPAQDALQAAWRAACSAHPSMENMQ